jgi:uncharacterized protein (DUF488 family)
LEIYTIGFTRIGAEEFFRRLADHGIKQLLDVRLNNKSQLAGFAKQDDLRFFLEVILGAGYRHEPLLAPTEDMLKAYKRDKAISWEDYERQFVALLRQRAIESELSPADFASPSVLLCSEATPENCHRRLVAEYLREQWSDVEVVHL